MIKNYLKLTLRNIKKYKGYSFLNIAGLAIGMVCAILILLWTQDELSFDRFHKKGEHIHRVLQEYHSEGGVTTAAITQAGLAEVLKRDFPEVIDTARIFKDPRQAIVRNEDKSFFESNICFADPSFLTMFSFPFIAGNPDKALEGPYSVVITEEIAKKYFGDSDPINKIFKIAFSRGFKDFRVTGVMKNIPHNSHLQFDFLVSFKFFYDIIPNFSSWDYGANYFTYVLLQEKASTVSMNQKLSGYLKKYIPQTNDKLSLQPLSRIHLHSDTAYDVPNNGDIKYVNLLSIVGIFVLLIACINFMNLATARSSKRAKEIGIRKVAGAKKNELIYQFIAESMILSIIALMVSLILVQVFLPSFNQFSGKQLSLDIIGSPAIGFGLIGIILFTGLIAGIYPAFFLSSFKPVVVLGGSVKSGDRGSTFRKVLVVFQFSISIILIVSTIIISKQVYHMRSREIGIDKKGLIYIPLKGTLREKYDIFKNELSGHPDIKSVTAANILPTGGNETIITQWEGKATGEGVRIHMTAVDYDYTETFKIKMVQGRSFSKEFPSDIESAVIVNEEAVKMMGMKSPVGKRIRESNTIIGVMKNYHFMSLHKKIEPIFIFLYKRSLAFAFIKLNPANISSAINHIERVYKTVAPGMPLDYRFLDDDLSNLYRSEQQVGSLYFQFTILAILISCLGLFGLASFMAEQRTKEIGIRKVLGASVSSIVSLLSKEFIKLVMASNIIAWPVAYLAMRKWLGDFAYRINLNANIWVFVVSAALALIVAVLTVSYQSIKAAIVNPVKSIKYE